MPNLLEEIQADLVNPSSKISDILRKAAVLAYRLKNDEFKAWVTYPHP